MLTCDNPMTHNDDPGQHSLGSLWQNTTIGRIGVNALLKSHPNARDLFEAPATFKVVTPMAPHATKFSKFGAGARGGGGVQSKNAADDAAFEIDWRQIVVHFGKNKGMEVWQLSQEQLSWYAIEWKGKEGRRKKKKKYENGCVLNVLEGGRDGGCCCHHCESLVVAAAVGAKPSSGFSAMTCAVLT